MRPLDLPCPVCSSAPGAPCVETEVCYNADRLTRTDRPRRAPHALRVDAALETCACERCPNPPTETGYCAGHEAMFRAGLWERPSCDR